MNIPKRQHTIPKVYLKNFSDQDGRLTVYSKRRNETTRPLPKDALVRTYYYSQPIEGIPNSEHGIETGLFNDLETQYPKLYADLINQNEVDLGLLFQIIYLFRARSPAFREAFEIGLAGMVDRALQSMPSSLLPQPPEGFPDLLEKLVVTIDPHRSLTAMAYYIMTYLKTVTSSTFIIGCAPKGCEFLTSDNPVVWFERGRKIGEESIYQNTPTSKTRLVIPLNKNMALIGRQNLNAEPDLRSGARILSRREMLELNAMQIACSWDCIIGKIRVPRVYRERYFKVVPHLIIDHFNPNNDSFSLRETKLLPYTEKHKHSYR